MNNLSKQVFCATVLFVLAFFLPSRYDGYAPAQTCVQSPLGGIVWWPLDETSGTTARDLAGNNPGIHVNGPVPVAGNVGGALRFNGSDQYVGAPDSDLWAFGSQNFTIELWANFASPGGGTIGHPSHIFIGNDEGSGTQNKWFFALGGGFLNFHINGPVVGSHFFPLGPFSPTLNQWYHLAVTRNGNVWTIYVNGASVASQVNAVVVPNPNAPLTIGQAEQLGFMNGLLDEVTIYNRALTQAELQAIVNAGSAGKCKALSISTKALSAIQLGTFSTQKLEALFGSAPFNWSVVNGTLPTGMTLTSDGVLSGTPTVAGSFPVTIRVTDSLNAIAEKDFALDVLLTLPPSNIRLHKTGTLAVPGRVLDYFIVVENVGNATASFSITESLEPWFNFVSANPPPTTIREGVDIFAPSAIGIYDALLIWEIVGLGPGESRVLLYRAKIDDSFPIGETVQGQLCLTNEECDDNLLRCQQRYKEVCGMCNDVSCLPGLPFRIQPRNRQECLRFAGKVCSEQWRMCSDGELAALRDGGSIAAASVGAVGNSTCSSHEQPTRGAVDPNEKGAVAKRFILPDQLLVYPIHFENIGNIEARDVFITDALDPNLDASTLNLLTPTGGSFDVATRTVKWNLLNTNLQPGKTGNVLLSVRPRPGLPSGTVIRNSAKIQFEVFQPIVTNEVVNIIDSTRPTSVVAPLPPVTSTPDFQISWSGSDAVGEIDYYTILVSVNGGAFMPFLERTRETNAVFRGELGKRYGFISVATDTAGNIEVQSAVAEAITQVIATGADLAITKIVAPNPVLTGSNVTYTITVANNGPGAAANVTVTDNLPASTTFVFCSSTGGGVCGGSGNNRTVNFTSLAAGASATITLVASVNCPVADNTVLTNTATVSSSTPDPATNNNSAMVTAIASNPPPVITGATANPSELWPPNHRLVEVTVNYNVTDNCGPLTSMLSVSSNEPINGTCDGDATPDWEIVDAHHVRLRAERAGNGTGRIYTITITCRDGAGNSSSRSVTVRVPKSQGQN